MTTKQNEILLLISVSILMFISCNSSRSTLEESNESDDTLTITEMVKMNAIEYFNLKINEDSTHQVSTDVMVVDSFTFKQNIDYRKNQINDSIKYSNDNNKTIEYKKIIYLLDSIEKSLGSHINDLLSYKYKLVIKDESPHKFAHKQNEKSENFSTVTSAQYFYTDATDDRQIICHPNEIKHKVLNPVEFPDYYKRIDREENR